MGAGVPTDRRDASSTPLGGHLPLALKTTVVYLTLFLEARRETIFREGLLRQSWLRFVSAPAV